MANDTKFAFLKENKGVGDLSLKEIIELKEMLERQDHLLLNKSLINKLKDKGEKIKIVRNEIAKELEARNAKNNKSEEGTLKNNSECEWKESKPKTLNTNNSKTKTDDKDVLKILAENGQVPQNKPKTTNKSHIRHLIDKDKDPTFSFKPYQPIVAEKIKKVVPNAHTDDSKHLPNIKILHLDESLHLLTEQMSVLKILGNESRRKRVEECIQDRINENNEFDTEHAENEELLDEFESKAGVSVNVNLSN